MYSELFLLIFANFHAAMTNESTLSSVKKILMSNSGFVQFLMIFFPPVPYLMQLVKIINSKSSEGFSTAVCHIILLSSIFKIAFWFRNPFDTALLLQCLILVLTNFVLLHYCYSYSNDVKKEAHAFMMPQNQTIFHLICAFLILQLSTIVFIMLLPYNSKHIQVIGSISSFLEALVTLPQLYYNYSNKNVKGLSMTMVIMWLCGDVFKFFYLVGVSAPFQFVYCNVFQTIVDIAIMGQVHFYRQK
uniref:PQ-loop repeat-containing protein 1 (Trinotate prediction) n=1 Tax=Myxobolus squamalis TaxID=59785 RepID=A0A6B2G2R8_MYXSQ